MQNPLRIVLIDDNLDDRTFIIRQLQREFSSLEIQEVHTADDFAQLLLTDAFDFVITDYQLFWIDGLTILRTLKAHRPDCPVIMFTGTGSEEIAVAALQANANDYLVKSPAYFALLPSRVRAALTYATSFRQMEAVRAVTTEITRELDLTTLLHLIITRAIELIRAAGSGVVYLLEDDSGTLIPQTWHERGDWIRDARIRPGEGLVGLCAQRQEGFLLNDYHHAPSTPPLVVAHVQRTAVLVEPLRYHDRLIGVILLDNQGTGQFFTPQDRDLLTFFASQAAIAIENARLFREVQERTLRLVQANEALQSEIAERQRAETEQHRLEARMRQIQKIEAIGTLAGGIAHDFNNMLAAILGYTDLALYEIPWNSPPWHHLQQVLAAGKRAKDLVRQILTFSRQHEQERRQVALHSVVTEALKILRASLPATIEIQQHLDPTAGVVLADPTQIQQVLMNLGANAEYAMRPQGGRLEIRLETITVSSDLLTAHPELTEGAYVRLTVRDTGHGMAPSILERIFEPFFTTKPVGEGSGMGLAVVHGIIAAHGGMITVQSAPQQGTVVALYFPRLEEATPASGAPESAERPTKQRILFVDDEVLLVQLAQAILTRLGYEPVVYTSSIEALEAFRQAPQQIDLVMTDQTMPGLTGEDLVRELRAIRPDIPIILCTGFSYLMSAEKAAALGVQAFLMKPLEAREFDLTIRQILEQSQDQT